MSLSGPYEVLLVGAASSSLSSTVSRTLPYARLEITQSLLFLLICGRELILSVSLARVALVVMRKNGFTTILPI